MIETKGFIVEKITKKGKSLKKPLYSTNMGEWAKSLDEAFVYGVEMYAEDQVRLCKGNGESCRKRKVIQKTRIIIK